MKRHRVFLLLPLWPALALLAGLVLALSMTSAQALPAAPAEAAQAPGGIQGILFEPDGITPVPGGWINIGDVDGQEWMGVSTKPDGSFAILNLPPNMYILEAYPPPGMDLAASLPEQVEVLSGAWANAELQLTVIRISGWVQDAGNGARIPGAPVVAHAPGVLERWDTSGANGEFKIGGVDIGVTYTLEVFPPEGTPYVPVAVPYTAVPTATDIALELFVPPTNIVGIVHNPLGDPVPGAGVVVHQEEFFRETAADEMGGFRFRGLPPGIFWLQAAPPWGENGEGLLASPPFSVTILQTDTLVDVGVITLPHAIKFASGRVLNSETGEPVPDAIVAAHRLDEPGFADWPVTPSGTFTLALPGGEWNLVVEPPPPPSPPVPWIFPGPPAWVPFVLPVDVPEEITDVTLEVVPTNAWVEGQILCPGEPPVPCGGPPFDLPQEAIRVELRSEQLHNDGGLGPDYRFNVPIRDGWYELVIHVDHPFLQGPEPMPVFVGPGQHLILTEPIVLWPKDARITGRVLNEQGLGVPGVSVVGWRPEGFGWGQAETDASGTYTMPVIGGEWFVEPQPRPEQPFVFRFAPRPARVAPGGTLAGLDFALTFAGSRIQGSAVDAATSERLWGLDGWTWAERELAPDTFEFFSDAPMWDSSFTLKAQGDETYRVGVEVPPYAPYVSGDAGPIYVPPQTLVSMTVPLQHKDAAIEGALVIAGSSPPQPAVPIWAEVFGEDDRGHWVVAGVDPQTGGYSLGVVSGTWRLRAWVDPVSGYAAPPTPTLVTLQAGQILPAVDLPVWPIIASISGRVLQPNGTPLSGTLVRAEGESPYIGHFETHGLSDATGNYELLVPEGGYLVGAVLPGDELQALGWLNSPPIDVPWVSADNPATGVDLRFRLLDGEIHGSINFAPGIVATPTHPAYVWAWADSGETAENLAALAGANTFTYTLRVVSDTVWHVGAVYEDPAAGVLYESAEAMLFLPPSPPVAVAVQNLQLAGPYALPQPFIVSFDATQMQTIIMPDGVQLRIPAGALANSGTVTLFIYPTQQFQPGVDREIIGTGYEIRAVDQNGQEITQFNANVALLLPYPDDATLQSLGVVESRLLPVYYSTLLGKWTLADSYLLDTEANVITLQIKHFTKFATSASRAAGSTVYVPILFRENP